MKDKKTPQDHSVLKNIFNEEIISFQNIDTQLNSLITSKYNMSPGGSNTHTHTYARTHTHTHTKQYSTAISTKQHIIVVLLQSQ